MDSVKKFTLKCTRRYDIDIDDNVSSIVVYEDSKPKTYHPFMAIRAEGISIAFMVTCCEEIVANIHRMKKSWPDCDIKITGTLLDVGHGVAARIPECIEIEDCLKLSDFRARNVYTDIDKIDLSIYKEVEHHHVSAIPNMILYELLTAPSSYMSALEEKHAEFKALGYKSIPPVDLPEAINIRFFDKAGMIWRYGEETDIPRIDILMVK